MARWNQYRFGTAKEVHALQAAAEYCRAEGLPFAADLETLHDKCTRPRPKSISYADAARIEKALVENAGGKVVHVAPGMADTFWIIVSRQLGGHGATVEQAARVGQWFAGQRWLRNPMTVDQVARGWPSYLSRAMAEEEAPRVEPQAEFGGDS